MTNVHFGPFQNFAMTQSRDFYIGLCLATGSSALIGSSFIVKKKALQALAVRAGTQLVLSLDLIHLNVADLPTIPFVAGQSLLVARYPAKSWNVPLFCRSTENRFHCICARNLNAVPPLHECDCWLPSELRRDAHNKCSLSCVNVLQIYCVAANMHLLVIRSHSVLSVPFRIARPYFATRFIFGVTFPLFYRCMSL